MGRTTDTLGPTPAATAEGPAPAAAAEGPAAEGPATTKELAAAVEPAVEGTTARGVGPWRT